MVKTQQILILALVVILLPGINESFVIKYDNQLFNLFSCHISSKEIPICIYQLLESYLVFTEEQQQLRPPINPGLRNIFNMKKKEADVKNLRTVCSQLALFYKKQLIQKEKRSKCINLINHLINRLFGNKIKKEHEKERLRYCKLQKKKKKSKKTIIKL